MNERPKLNQKPENVEQAIARYLQAHPDFFTRHPELAETLRVPHPCRPAVSLLEHQLLQLRERNAQLHKRLEELVEVARENGDLVIRIQRLTLVLIETKDLIAMLQGIKDTLKAEFNADFMALRFTGPAASLTGETLLSPAVQALFEPILDSGRPICGRLTSEQAKTLFDQAGPNIASAALVPLRGMDWYGLLAVGSQDERRFHPGMGTLFLSCMGELISHALQIHLYSTANSCKSSSPPASTERD